MKFLARFKQKSLEFLMVCPSQQNCVGLDGLFSGGIPLFHPPPCNLAI